MIPSTNSVQTASSPRVPMDPQADAAPPAATEQAPTETAAEASSTGAPATPGYPPLPPHAQQLMAQAASAPVPSSPQPLTAAPDRRGHVVIHRADGSTETHAGGSLNWRNNNPGNMRSGIDGHPAIGRNHGFAIFPDAQAGFDAMVANLQTPRYQALTVGEAIADWAPGSDGNDPARYAAQIARWTGIDANTPMSQLNADQLKAVANAIKRYEGWRPGTLE